MKSPLPLVVLTLAGAPLAAPAADVTLEIEIPRLEVAEYHRPYVAAWIENDQKKFVSNLFVWYQVEATRPGGDHGDHGEKWLKDLRKWWRVSGRDLKMPVDGLASPTKPAGKHQVSLTKAFQNLPGGTYTLLVEASREVGGRELLSVPFTWDGSALKAEKAQGSGELGSIILK